jgi:hypothetical protein
MYYDPTCQPVPVELVPWRKGLLAAADYIEQHGWCQHIGKINGHVCASVALNMVGCPNMSWLALTHLVGRSIPRWNDAPGRTKEEVVAAMRKAAWAP